MAGQSGLAARAGVGDPSSPHYPRPYNPSGPYAHGFPIHGNPPDIAPWASGNTGIPFLWTFESARSGPHAALIALTHGEEWCGAVVLDRLLREGFRPACGRLSLLFANFRAHARWDPQQPNRAFFIDRDLNRVWDAALLDSEAKADELDRARQLRPWLETVDVLLDLHSTQQPSPPMAFCGPADKTLDFARSLGWPPLLIRDVGHAAGRRLRDFGAFDDPQSPRVAIVVECGQHWAADTPQNALQAARAFLARLDMASLPALPAWDGPTGVVQVTHQITAAKDACLDAVWPDFAIVPQAGTRIGKNAGEPILTPWVDTVLLMPVRRPRPGTTMLRMGRFV